MSTALDPAALQLLEEHVRRLLALMGFTAVTVHCHAGSVGEPAMVQLSIAIEAGEAGKVLIGAQGAHLEALQHILRMLLRRQLAQTAFIAVDVNGYRARYEHSLKEMAETAAQQAHRTGTAVVLRPMSAGDRRVLHTALAERSDVKSESLGDEPNRRVVVRPVSF